MKVLIGRYPKNPNKTQKVNVRIDKWDTWSMDTTLAHIIVPMLKQLKATKHGAPLVELEDVPEHLRSEKTDEYGVDSTHFERWDYVMDEMIFAFESKLIEWEDQFWKRSPELNVTTYPEDAGKDMIPLRWKDEGDCDWDGMREYGTRIQNGFLLFGKYYQGLWD
jgi:hypothetical protein